MTPVSKQFEKKLYLTGVLANVINDPNFGCLLQF